ncbi:MAG TPA: alpha/beta hydrolase [Chitinophagaceae bacterium]|nr:alpha/beta hydrolase [Chitinophagaceae bacterium]
MMKRLLLLSFVLLGLIACKKEDVASGSTLQASTIKNLAYGTDPQQKMDVYLPAGRSSSSTNVMILIHGGAWVEGDKSDFDLYVDTLKKRLPGYAFFNINYRLATGTANFFPTQENDVKAAIELIAQKLTEYQISDKVVLLGASAGGHLALLQGYKYASPIKPAAIIDFFGPTDMAAMYNNPVNPLTVPIINAIIGGTPGEQPDLYYQSSPIHFVDAHSPPTMILQGGMDDLVAVSQSTSLQSKLQDFGVLNQYVFYPNDGHGWDGEDLTDSFDRIVAFLAETVK